MGVDEGNLQVVLDVEAIMDKFSIVLLYGTPYLLLFKEKSECT